MLSLPDSSKYPFVDSVVGFYKAEISTFPSQQNNAKLTQCKLIFPLTQIFTCHSFKLRGQPSSKAEILPAIITAYLQQSGKRWLGSSEGYGELFQKGLTWHMFPMNFLCRYQGSQSGWEIKWPPCKASLLGQLLSSYASLLLPSLNAPVTWLQRRSSYLCWPQW